MKFTPPVIDYRKIRPNNAFSKEYRHFWTLLFWVFHYVVFSILEYVNTPERCTLITHPWDDKIPFLEIFVIPYLLWFVALIAIHAYTLLYDVPLYKRLISYIALTYTTALIIFAVFPNWQNLRPTEFERDNFLVDFMKYFYANVDTPTNVLPSLHVVGSMAVMCTVLHSKRIKNPVFKGIVVVVCILISISTVFLKQHSVWDVIAAIPICIIAEIVCFQIDYKKLFQRKKALSQPALSEELAVSEDTESPKNE